MRPAQAPIALRRCSVAVVGAGAAGLVAARELLREGHTVCVFEQGGTVGGVWQYTDDVEDEDLLGADPRRPKRVHSSMYRNLRTNLPREIMGFTDFPFTPTMLGPRSVDPRRFCGHQEVMRYLQAFCDYYNLAPLVKFQTRVEKVTPLWQASGQQQHPSTPLQQPAHQPPQPIHGLPCRWRVLASSGVGGKGGSRADGAASAEGAGRLESEFDAVVVCNGHYSEPKLPQVHGASTFPLLQMHSHNYRSPEQFKDQVVLVVGASNSGIDVAYEVAEVASRVYLSARTWKDEPLGQAFGSRGNIYRMPLVSELTDQGAAVFPAFPGSNALGPSPTAPTASSSSSYDTVVVPTVHAVIYCTGYQYTFPFLLDTEPDPSQEQRRNHGDAAAEGGGPSGQGLAPAVACGGVDAVISMEDQRVGPLYLHMFPPSLAPGLSFLGLPWKVVPFPQAELQAKLVARALSGRVSLPLEHDMLEAVHDLYRSQRQAGTPVRYTHMQGTEQWQYNDVLAAMCGADVAPTDPWRVTMYSEIAQNRRTRPDTYRDGPFSALDQKAIKRAHAELDQMAAELWRNRPGWEASAGAVQLQGMT